MLYYIFRYLNDQYNFPGAGLFEFISFRAALAVIFSLVISLIYGRQIIKILQKRGVVEGVRDLGLLGQKEKEGTPTMGGVIIIVATVVPVLFLSKIENVYIILLVATTIWMGLVGFADDYIKVFKRNKKGLKGKFKILGQVGIGVIVGITLYVHPLVTIKETTNHPIKEISHTTAAKEVKSTKTTIPFLKNNEFDYADILRFLGENYKKYAWLLFIPVVIIIVSAVSNATNLTDGIDGLVAGSSTIVVLTLGVFAWLSGNIIFSDYLNIMYIPRVGEVAVFLAAFAGGLIGFLWFNSFPAQVFMGDTGSLAIGSVIAVIAIIVRKELLIPIFCGVFFIETLSVIFQVGYFKYTKKRFGKGKRIFLMSPLHHHFQRKGVHESKIVSRFLIIGVLFAVVAVITLKIR